jgi:hypothetical protein
MSKYIPSFPSGRGNDSLFCGRVRSYSRYSSNVGGNGPRSIAQIKYDDTARQTRVTTSRATDIRGRRLINDVVVTITPKIPDDPIVSLRCSVLERKDGKRV